MKVYIARRSRRVATNWPGRYLGPHGECWAECRVINLSMGGAALDIAVPASEPQGRLTLALHDEDGQPLGLELQADVSWWDRGADPDRLRVGVRFVGVNRLEGYALAGLTSKQRRQPPLRPWVPQREVADDLAGQNETDGR